MAEKKGEGAKCLLKLQNNLKVAHSSSVQQLSQEEWGKTHEAMGKNLNQVLLDLHTLGSNYTDTRISVTS